MGIIIRISLIFSSLIAIICSNRWNRRKSLFSMIISYSIMEAVWMLMEILTIAATLITSYLERLTLIIYLEMTLIWIKNYLIWIQDNKNQRQSILIRIRIIRSRLFNSSNNLLLLIVLINSKAILNSRINNLRRVVWMWIWIWINNRISIVLINFNHRISITILNNKRKRIY